MSSYALPDAGAYHDDDHKGVSLRSSTEYLKGVGARSAERLAQMGICQVKDLLFHLPLRYQDRTRIVPIGSLRAGDHAVIQGEVQLTDVRFGKRRMLLSRLSDGTGSITLRFFHFSKSQQQRLAKGVWLRCYGEVRKGSPTLEMVHPEYHFINNNEVAPVEDSLTPIYPATEGVRQATFRSLTDQALALLVSSRSSRQDNPAESELFLELLPEDIRQQLNLPTLLEALLYVHRPPPDASIAQLQEGSHPAQKRLSFEELLAQQLSMRVLRNKVHDQKAPSFRGAGKLLQQFYAQLPFSLTGAQQRVIDEILLDLENDHPMQRLVQGDVGCGKTVVATAAVLQAVESGYQAAVMAPTDLLSEQHYNNLCEWLAPLGVEVVWLSGKTRGAARSVVLERIADGAQVVVGTHALFQESVVFSKLGFVVIDEQHRFGVHQRLVLREKGRQGDSYPHQLIMTATPIPRTLAMTAYADLDSSIIDELPPGRKPVTTVILSDDRRDDVLQRVKHACGDGCQAYWVCTLIEESEVLQCQAAVDAAKLLQESLPDIKVGLVHGRMKPQEKADVMEGFKNGLIDLLVATTVIEVGVDVPNASLMIIENAERLGLAQLHQLRGRVGRGRLKSSCVLMYHGPLSSNGKARLAALRESNDGFEIARRDLELRGPGAILGTQQTGMMQFRIADLIRDQDLMTLVTRVATAILKKYPAMAELIIRRWIGDAQQYGDI